MQFNFLTSQIVVFNTRRQISHPRELAKVIPTLSAGSIFYHVIDARRRTVDGMDDIRAWIAGFGSAFGDQYRDLCDQLGDVDPFFSSLTELRDDLAAILDDRLPALERALDAAGVPWTTGRLLR